MADCQNYGSFLGRYYNTGPNLGDPKGTHNLDNPPCRAWGMNLRTSLWLIERPRSFEMGSVGFKKATKAPENPICYVGVYRLL